ncbi:MAG TPA: ATP synthase F1 subunit epsilon [Kofleriaceae bacterium]|nr:ATP synthase F1 subunit epsilon [Kofleriaceae bacterium]
MATGLSTILGVNLVTPRGVVAHTDADSVQAPGENGEFELLPGHVPLLAALRPGVLTIGGGRPGQEAGAAGSVTRGQRARYAVSSGYLRVDPSGIVEILVEQAQPAGDVDAEVAKKDLAAAEAELAKWGDKPLDGDYLNVQQRAGWARARIDAVMH